LLSICGPAAKSPSRRKSEKSSIFLSGSSRFLAGKGVAVINAVTGKPKTNNL
jgi:hypothetical protein